MAHYARVHTNGTVVSVIVAEPNFLETYEDPTPGTWVQCSYNTRGGVHYLPNSNTPSEDQSKALRKNYPSFGYKYLVEQDMFVPHKPFESWTLDLQTGWWVAPVAKPEDNKSYLWNEAEQKWDLVS